MNATVNGITFENLTMEQAQALIAMANTTAIDQAKETKPKAKPKAAAKYDKTLDSQRVGRMVDTAVKTMAKQGYDVKPSKRGTWVWLYSTEKLGRDDGFKAVKLAKGWNYSPKRGAFYRDFKVLEQ